MTTGITLSRRRLNRLIHSSFGRRCTSDHWEGSGIPHRCEPDSHGFLIRLRSYTVEITVPPPSHARESGGPGGHW